MNAQTLQVPGATLYYEVCGSGPILLLIAGGNGDAATFGQIAGELADTYTVVTYDRRGFSRSPLDGPPDRAGRLDADVEDAARLIDLLGDGPALVLGSSSGAIIGLELLARHPERVRTLVAHEPPLLTLLPDAAVPLELLDRVYETYQRSGPQVAMQQFGEAIGMGGRPQPPPGAELPPQLVELMTRINANLHFFIEYELREYTRIEPDLAALKTVSDRLVLAGGRDSREYFPYRPNTVLAERLGREVVDFPGGHIGYTTHPAEFADHLREVLA